MSRTTQQHLKNYKDYLRIQNYSPSTVKSYLTGLRQFLEFRETNLLLEKIDQEQARQFILFKYDQGVKWQTINNVYSSLRKYFIEVLHIEWSTDMIKRPRREYTLPVLISKDEVKRIIESCTMYKYQIFITLLYSTGIRLSEALNIRFENIDRQTKRLLIKRGKGSRDRYVDLSSRVILLLIGYYMREQPRVYLFNGMVKGKKLASTSAQKAIKKAVQSAKIFKRVSVHTFRHCYATHHLEQGTNIVYIQKQMGHKHLKTTSKYIHLSKTYHHNIVHPLEKLQITYMKGSRR